MSVWRLASGAWRALLVSGLLSALAAGPARAQPGACRLVVGVTPRTVPAAQESAQILVFGTGRLPSLVSSAGTIHDLRRESRETYVARYVPPREGAPRAAVIAAFLDDGSCGMAIVRFEEAPGAPKAPAPPPPVALGFLPRATQLDGDVEVPAFVFAADDAGRPRGGGPPTVKVDVGTVSPAEPVCPGVWRARWRVQASRAARGELTASFPGGATATAGLGTELASLEVVLDRSRVVSGTPEPVTVTVRAWDEAHRPTEAELVLSASAGTLSKPRLVERGVYQASLSLPQGPHGAGVINVRARVGAIQGQATLAYGAGEAAALAIEGPDSMQCDGTSAVLGVTVADSQGNPVDDQEPALEARLAALGDPHRVGPGRWLVSYRPRCTLEPSTDLVVALAGQATGQRAIQLSVPTRVLSLGPKGGLAVQSGGSGFAVSAEGALWTRLRGQQMGLVLEIARWSLVSRGTIDGLGAYVDERSYLPVLLSAAWRRPLQGQFMLWVSAGGGAAQVGATNRLSAQAAVSAAAWAPVFSGALSLGRWTPSGLPFIEARGTWVGDPGLPTLRGSLTSFLLQLGYRFHGW